MRAGMKEYELEAMLHYEMQKQGCRNFGFVPIIAAGENAATLHYIDNNTTIEDNQLVLLDVVHLMRIIVRILAELSQ